MLSEEQLKSIEYLVTGHTITETAKELEIASNTIRNWMKNNADLVSELSKATDLFAKECQKGRSRAYRTVNKKITDKILEKIENDGLENYKVDELIRMLDKSVLVMKNDEDSLKRLPSLTAIQQNIQIGGDIQEKLKDKQFVDKFSELLIELSPEDIQTVVETKEKLDREIAYESSKK